MTEPEERRTRQDERGTGWRPNPDPTQLTTDQLHREIRILKDLLDERMQSMDALMDEKFEGVTQKFTLIEAQRIEQKGDAKEALAAALQAAKEAVQDQTTAARKDIDALSDRFDIAMKGQSEQIGSLTGRVTVMEAIKLGTQETKAGIGSSLGLMIGGGGLILSIILVAGDVLTK